MEILDPSAVNSQALAALRIELDEVAKAHLDMNQGTSHYAHALMANDAVQRLIDGDWPMQWSANYQLAADDPLTVMTNDRDLRRAVVRRTLLQAVGNMRADLVLISPYFVPGDSITTLLADAVNAGKRVRVLTNSLVANDVSAVHGGYSRYRKALLAGGVEIWELKRGSAGASLHTKAMLVDRKTLFVGSYNFDPRSAWLNCEQGVLVESETLARELATIFARHLSGERAWHVTLADDELSWSDGTETFSKDPHSSFVQRLQAWIVRVLRLEPQL